MMTLLLFLPADMAQDTPWLLLDDGGVLARGSGYAALPAHDRLVAVVPGEAVVLHWVALPALAPAQAAAAARMMAADVSAAPVQQLHVALGKPEADGQRLLAMIDSEAMRGWLAVLAASGLDPDVMLPEPLLLAAPDTGAAMVDTGGRWLVRGPRLGFAAEAGLAQLLLADTPALPVTVAAYEAGMAAALAEAGIDLRQGDFARVRRWRPDRARIRRAAVLAALAALALLAADLVTMFRYDAVADRAEIRLGMAAQAVLPRGTVIANPEAQVAARLAALGGNGGLGGVMTPLLAALATRPAISLESVDYTAGRGVVAVLDGAGGDDVAGLVAQLQASGIAARPGPQRDANGRVLTELTLGVAP